MKWLLFTLLLLTTSRLQAQGSPAGDKDAIDFSAKMDTIGKLPAINVLNGGLINADPFQDFYLGGCTDCWSPARFGGPLIFDQISHYAILREAMISGDFTGTGRIDIIDNRPEYHQLLDGHHDSIGTTIFRVHGRFPNIGIIGVADVNGDGIDDMICGANAELGFSNGIVTYRGSSHIADSAFKYPDDSVENIPGNGPAALGVFNRAGKPMLFLSGSFTDPNPPHQITYKIGVMRRLDSLAHDSVVWLSHTTNNDFFNPGDSMIVAKGMYAMDITGDGITDVLVTDDVHIWIFKGEDSLGYYPLTKNRAYYSIPNPKLLDPFLDGADVMDHFGRYMHSCGDITGSGIPYLMVDVEADVSRGFTRAWSFFYAGGKALDSLYDARVILADQGEGYNMDTLHSIDNSGRTAVILHELGRSEQDIEFLLYKGADKIPHKTNPHLQVAFGPTSIARFEIASYPTFANRYEKFQLNSPERLTGIFYVRNILGQVVMSRTIVLDTGENTEYFDTSNWPSGTYIGEFSDHGETGRSKFIVQH